MALQKTSNVKKNDAQLQIAQNREMVGLLLM